MIQYSIFREVDSLSRHINNIYENIFKKYRLHRGQFIFISRIVENQNINLKDLAKITRADKTTVTKAVQKLEENQYITKHIDATDNRITHLHPTELCIELYNKVISEKNKFLEAVLKDFPTAEVASYIQMTKNLNNYLDKVIGEHST